MENGFFRVAAVVPSVNVADCDYNTDNIITECDKLYKKGVSLVVFPELALTGYTCADLFRMSTMHEAVNRNLSRIVEASFSWSMTVVVGAPVIHENRLYDCAVVINSGNVVAVVPKSYLQECNGVNEKRWWRSGIGVSGIVHVGGCHAVLSVNQMFNVGNVTVGIELGSDLWAPVSPSARLSMAGAQVIVNLAAVNDSVGKYAYMRQLILQQSARCVAAYVCAGAGYGESTTDMVFDGKCFIAENGQMLAESLRWDVNSKTVVADIDIDAINNDRQKINLFGDCADNEIKDIHYYTESLADDLSGFESDSILRRVNPHPFIPGDDDGYREVFEIQVAGLMKRLQVTRAESLVVGISGGLDSTLALLVAVEAFERMGLPREGIVAVTMPGFGTSDRTCNNAKIIMSRFAVTQKEISIVPAVSQHFMDIDHDADVHDVTFENSQARERTQILMDIANKVGGMVLGTGDLSELALGWATYNGDHMSMYGVNAGVPKTLVKRLVVWLASRIDDEVLRGALLDIVDTPISPELTPVDEKGDINQKTEDLVGPYELHDFVLFYVLRYGYAPRKIFLLAKKAFDGTYDDEVIKYWMKVFFRRFFNQQFKRSCMPDGPKIGSVGLSPRGDWQMPSDASSALWLKECDEL